MAAACRRDLRPSEEKQAAYRAGAAIGGVIEFRRFFGGNLQIFGEMMRSACRVGRGFCGRQATSAGGVLWKGNVLAAVDSGIRKPSRASFRRSKRAREISQE